MADTKSKAQMLADECMTGRPEVLDAIAAAAELRRLDAVEAERGVLLHAVEEWRKLADWQSARLASIEAERDALRAEVERLRVDAERWRWVVRNCEWTRSLGNHDAPAHSLLSVRLPYEADQSCVATRTAAIDAARGAA